ncbi:unnamed protein product [Linum trigynum]|uniref:Uncharacterized protein n=1 Tax=Linum trigynum TaxID=586398 RepID=A0AAV2E4K4_9ROSI
MLPSSAVLLYSETHALSLSPFSVSEVAVPQARKARASLIHDTPRAIQWPNDTALATFIHIIVATACKAVLGYSGDALYFLHKSSMLLLTKRQRFDAFCFLLIPQYRNAVAGFTKTQWICPRTAELRRAKHPCMLFPCGSGSVVWSSLS